MEQANQHLGTERIGTLIFQYAVPCIISLLVGALYNIFDQVFIANASYLGSYGNAANTVVFPLTVVALAIAVMIGDGCCAFVSISLGKGENDPAKRSVGNAVVMSVGSSLVLTAIYLLFRANIIDMFGGTVNEETYHYSQEYFFFFFFGLPLYMFGQSMNPVIRADGSPKFAMLSTLAGAAANLVLDPIFIFGFRWGMMGAAVATVIGQMITAVLAVWYLLHMKNIRPSRRDFRMDRNVCGRTLFLGRNRPGSSTISFRGVAQLVARLLWVREAQVRATVLGKPGKPWDTWADSTFPTAGNWSKIGVDHMFDHNWKISYPGVAQLVARLLWEQDAGSSSLPTRTILCGHLGEQGGLRNTPDLSGVFLVFSLIC